MDHYYYLLALLVSFGGLVLADYRYKLLLVSGSKVAVLLVGLGFFLIWDIVGLLLGVFATNTRWVSGLYIGTPNLPLEEFMFLLFLSYCTLIIWRLVCLRTS